MRSENLFLNAKIKELKFKYTTTANCGVFTLTYLEHKYSCVLNKKYKPSYVNVYVTNWVILI